MHNLLARLGIFSILLISEVQCSLSYDPADYLEVYPDPRDSKVVNGRVPLHFALLQSLGGPLSQLDGSGAVAGVKVALDRINNDSSLLPGYSLHYTFTDSKVCILTCYSQLQLRTLLWFISPIVQSDRES